MDFDFDKFSVMENVFQKINQKHVALPLPDKQRNSYILDKVVKQMITKMELKSDLFKNLFQKIYYGGSYYDNLRVSEPSEYDLDFLFVLPKLIETTVVSKSPGFVNVVVKSYKNLEKQKDLYDKFRGLGEFLEDSGEVNTKKVLKWMTSVANLALNEFRADINKDEVLSIQGKSTKDVNTPATIQVEIEMDDKPKEIFTVQMTLSSSGPALTLKLNCRPENGESFNIDVDMVASILFGEAQWPKGDYRENSSKKNRDFFVVPKGPDQSSTVLWRLSFQQQEKELLNGDCKHLKPCVRLMKKLRDRYSHKISSYAIKSFFMRELVENGKEQFDKPLSVIFMMTLERYAAQISTGEVPYFWNSKFNLIDLKPQTCTDIANCFKRIFNDVKRNFEQDPFVFAKFLLTPEELLVLKSEVVLGKKYQTTIHDTCIRIDSELPKRVLAMSSSSSTSSIIDNVNSEIMKKLESIEQLCLNNFSANKECLGKINELELKLEQLNCRLTSKENAKNSNVQNMFVDIGLLAKDVAELKNGGTNKPLQL